MAARRNSARSGAKGVGRAISPIRTEARPSSAESTVAIRPSWSRLRSLTRPPPRWATERTRCARPSSRTTTSPGRRAATGTWSPSTNDASTRSARMRSASARFSALRRWLFAACRSTWNWAKERASRSTASARVRLTIRLATMLYVGRKADRRTKSRLPARLATRSNDTKGDQQTMACPSLSRPRRPARPVSWVNWPGVRTSCVWPVNFVSRSITTVRAGRFTPRASVSVA